MCLQFAPRAQLSTWPKISNSHAVIACPECRCSDVGQTAQHVVTSWNWCSGNIIGCYRVARALWKAIWGRPGALPLSVNILHTPPTLAQLTAIATAMLHVATLFIWQSWVLWSILKLVMEVNMEERIDHPSRGTWLWSSHYRSLLYCVILQTRRYSTKEIQTKEPLTVLSAHMCTFQPFWMKNFDLRNLDCPHSSLKEQARIASGWRSREVGKRERDQNLEKLQRSHLTLPSHIIHQVSHSFKPKSMHPLLHSRNS